MTAQPFDYTSPSWRRRRAALIANSPRVCARCGLPIPLDERVVAGHVIDRALGGSDDVLQVECVPCSVKAGGELRAALARAAAGDDRALRYADQAEAQRQATTRAPASASDSQPAPASDHDASDTASDRQAPAAVFCLPPQPANRPPAGVDPPEGTPRAFVRHPRASTDPGDASASWLSVAPDSPWSTTSDDPAWDAAPWLADLRQVPPDATWPRLMTAPHPLAVGSYAAEFETWALARGTTLRWWQRLVVARMLEHDARGSLLWLVVLITTSRQVGKSVLLRELALWRIEQGDRFGEQQLVMHTGKDLPVCREIQRPARAWARTQPDWSARDTNGQEEVQAPDGSRWMIRGKDSVYGYSASMPLVDEAWAVSPRIVDEALEATMLDREQPQMVITSTAHRRATNLFPGRRAGALDTLTAPDDVLLLEWSADPEADPTDQVAWRAASPYWTTRRARLLESKVGRALAGEDDADTDGDDDPLEAFRSQYLNIWTPPAKRLRARDEPLLSAAAWDAAHDVQAAPTPGAMVVALEDYYGLGAAAAACSPIAGDPDRFLVWGQVFPNRAGAVAWAGALAASSPGATGLVGGSLAAWAGPLLTDAGAQAFEPVGLAQTRVALPMLRHLLGADRLRHDGSPTLADQARGAVVVASTAGLAMSPRSPRSDALRCAAWALYRCATQAAAEPFLII